MPFVFFKEGERPEPEQKGTFQIYQLPGGDKYHGIRFEGMEQLKNDGVQLNKDDYELVYEGEVGEFRGNATLEALFAQFNTNHPEDFRGHSLSVSDIVALKQNGVVSCHYVDSFGFAELPDFMKPENYLKNAEMVMEDDYGMIDGVINNGKSAATEERKSVLQQLKDTPAAEAPRKPSRRSKERDLE